MFFKRLDKLNMIETIRTTGNNKIMQSLKRKSRMQSQQQVMIRMLKVMRSLKKKKMTSDAKKNGESIIQLSMDLMSSQCGKQLKSSLLNNLLDLLEVLEELRCQVNMKLVNQVS